MSFLPRFTKVTVVGLLATTASLSAGTADEVMVAVAANFTDAAGELATAFEKATGHTLTISYASSGKLYSQIENGAPFAVFLSADAERSAKAEAEGLAVAGTRFTYALGKLALWSPKPDLFQDGEAYLKANGFAHAAIANPKTAPYGLAAQQVLSHLELWTAVQPKLVQGDTIAQAFQFVSSGNAEVGFVALSQFKAWRDGPTSTWEVPLTYYEPIVQQAVLLKKGEANPAAAAFLDFLKSTAAQEIIVGYGYGLD